MMHCESQNELNACVLFDADSSVVSFKEQPVKIEFTVDDFKYTHYPDFLVIKKNSTELIEVKDDIAQEPNEILMRTKILEKYLPDFGVDYRLICGRKMAKSCVLNNAKYLLRYSRCQIVDYDHLQLERAFESNKIDHWSDFNLFDQQSKNLALLCRLILEGFVAYDSTQPISDETKIYWNY